MKTIEILKETSLFMDDINNLDLSMIKLKLQDKEEGPGWSRVQCNLIEKEYKKFIALRRAYPELEIVPHKRIDMFWHQHILDTEKYAEDCNLIFGYFLHHYPYFGMNGDAQALVNAFEETKVLYKRNFGDAYVGEAPKCKAPKCRTACKPVKCK